MEVYDISRGMFSTPIYPGDPPAKAHAVRQIAAGDLCNLSEFSIGCHTATHIDAPLHFVPNGASIDQLPLGSFLGPCTVVTMKGILTGAEIDALAPRCEKRILFRGEGELFLSQSAAFALADSGILLVGTDAQSIGPFEGEQPPHFELLSAGIPILEGLDLSGVEDGTYQLIALPLRLEGLEGSPCRAVLLRETQITHSDGLPVEYREIRWNSPEYQAMLSLRDRILRKPLGLDLYREDLSHEYACRHITAWKGKELVGSLVLERLDDSTMKMKQVAVDELHRGHGIGTGMVRYAEELCRKEGIRTILVHARCTAEGFYRRNGYQRTSGEFIEVGIPHVKMAKVIQGRTC